MTANDNDRLESIEDILADLVKFTGLDQVPKKYAKLMNEVVVLRLGSKDPSGVRKYVFKFSAAMEEGAIVAYDVMAYGLLSADKNYKARTVLVPHPEDTLRLAMQGEIDQWEEDVHFFTTSPPDDDAPPTVSDLIASLTFVEHPDSLLIPLKDEKKEEEVEKKKLTVPEYDLKLVNTDITPKEMVRKIKTALKKEDCPALTLLFHGQPGTSKTQTAKYLAQELDLPLHTHQLGQILGKYVGESEKAIGKMFTKAKEEGAILHIDEIEGLMRTREKAEQSWQLTQVNAILQAIDEYDGILICTTNFLETMDKALLRRFLLKMEFFNLTEEQATSAGRKFFKGKRIGKLEGDIYAPADFALVKKGFLFMEEEDITKAYIKDQLRKEADARRIIDVRVEEAAGRGKSYQRRTIGFGANIDGE